MTFCEANLPVIHFEEYYNNFRKQLLGSGVLYANVNLRFIKLTILKHLVHFIMLLYTDGIDISLHVIDMMKFVYFIDLQLYFAYSSFKIEISKMKFV